MEISSRRCDVVEVDVDLARQVMRDDESLKAPQGTIDVQAHHHPPLTLRMWRVRSRVNRKSRILWGLAMGYRV